MDQWIIAANANLIKFFREEMKHYRLYTVVPKLITFLDQLTNWYVRLNRDRIKGDEGEKNWIDSLNVLFDVLLKVTILLSPFVPFITDQFYLNLKKAIKGPKFLEDSIHFMNIPEFSQEVINDQIELDVKRMQQVIVESRAVREKKIISLK